MYKAHAHLNYLGYQTLRSRTSDQICRPCRGFLADFLRIYPAIDPGILVPVLSYGIHYWGNCEPEPFFGYS